MEKNYAQLRKISELNHVTELSQRGYDFSCLGCGYMYRKRPIEFCDICDSIDFLTTKELIKKIEFDL